MKCITFVQSPPCYFCDVIYLLDVDDDLLDVVEVDEVIYDDPCDVIDEGDLRNVLTYWRTTGYCLVSDVPMWRGMMAGGRQYPATPAHLTRLNCLKFY